MDSGPPDVVEVCSLTQFLLDMVSLDTYADTPTEHLPGLFLRVLIALTKHCDQLNAVELAASLQLCRRVLVRVQPGSWGPSMSTHEEDDRASHVSLGSEVREIDDASHPDSASILSPTQNVMNEQLEVNTELSMSSITNNEIIINNSISLVKSESNSDLKYNKQTLTEDATAATAFLDSEGTLDLTDPVSIDSDSSASLLMDSSHTPVDAVAPSFMMLDSRSAEGTKAETSLPDESDWSQKASELQSLMEATTSLSLASEVSGDSTSAYSGSTTLPFYESITSQTSLASSQENPEHWTNLVTDKVDSITIHSPVNPEIKINDQIIKPKLKFTTSTKSDSGSCGEKSSRQQSVMSECLLQFQELFVRLVGQRVLSRDTNLEAALHHLLSIPPKDSSEHRTRELESKLKECLGVAEGARQQSKGWWALPLFYRLGDGC